METVYRRRICNFVYSLKNFTRSLESVTSTDYKGDTGEQSAMGTKKRRMLIYAKGDKMFVDWKRLRVKAGDGGRGSASFVHSRDKKGGPDGGDGGRGGDVSIIADASFTQLAHLKPLYRLQAAGNGSKKNRHGKNGEGIFIRVPPGTVIRNLDTSEVLSDLVTEGERVIVARGGAGGLGNVHFKTPTHVRPQEFTEGGVGDEIVLEIEMKSIADVGLVGFPNAGKSTLLRCLSRASPKVADYPFTTLKPNIGAIMYDDETQLRVADIPGLIEGAHINKGLGHVFLRHIERCNCLLYVIDASLPDPLLQLKILKRELEMYKIGLSDMPAAVVANKIDLLNSQKVVIDRMQTETDVPVIAVSAKLAINNSQLKELIKSFFVHKRN